MCLEFLSVLLYLLHMFLELKALQQNWVWELMCFGLLVPYQHYCRDSWKIFYLDWCFLVGFGVLYGFSLNLIILLPVLTLQPSSYIGSCFISEYLAGVPSDTSYP